MDIKVRVVCRHCAAVVFQRMVISNNLAELIDLKHHCPYPPHEDEEPAVDLELQIEGVTC